MSNGSTRVLMKSKRALPGRGGSALSRQGDRGDHVAQRPTGDYRVERPAGDQQQFAARWRAVDELFAGFQHRGVGQPVFSTAARSEETTPALQAIMSEPYAV